MNKNKCFSKLSLILALLMSIALLLPGCEKVPKTDGETEPSDVSEKAAINARIEIQIDDQKGNNRVQIPKFVSDVPSEAIDAINADIEPLIEVYEKANKNVLKWPEIYTHIYDSDEYLQAVVEYQEMPALDLDYNIKTYNYDEKNDKALQISDALDMAGYTEAKFATLVEELFDSCDEGGDLKKYEINGFYISNSGIVQFFVRVYVDTGMDEYSLMTTVIPKTKKLFTTDENGLYIIE